MVRGIMFFLLVWLFVVIGIAGFRALSGAEKWSLVKTVSYGLVTAVVTSVIIGMMVVIF